MSTTNLWKKYAPETRPEDWAGMSEAEVRRVLAQAGATAEEIESEIVLFMDEIPTAHTCANCGIKFHTYKNDTAQSGECFGYPELCWSCGVGVDEDDQE